MLLGTPTQITSVSSVVNSNYECILIKRLMKLVVMKTPYLVRGQNILVDFWELRCPSDV